MDSATSFLQAIRENPEDDTPRLVFADWLEERGDPRGTFLRLQCEGHRWRELHGEHTFRGSLLREESLLLEQNRSAWLGPLAVLPRYNPDGPRAYFERSLIHLDLPVEDFLQRTVLPGAEWELWPWVEGLYIFDPRDWGDHGIAHVLYDEMAGDVAVSPLLERFSSLRTCSSTPTALELLLGSPYLARLTVLHLSYTEDAGGPAALAALPEAVFTDHLKELYLRNGGVSDEVLAGLSALPRLRGLRTLDLEDNHRASYVITERGLRALTSSPYLRGLTSLGLCHNRLGDEALLALASSPGLNALRSLDLSGNPDFTARGFHALARSPLLANLRTLNLASCGEPGALAAGLAASPGLPRLSALNLAHNLSASPEQFLALLPALPDATLTSLNLRGSALGAEGAAALASSPKLASLRFLVLNSSTLTDAGARLLASSPYLGGLEHLEVERCDLSLDGVKALLSPSRLRNLRSLNLADNDLTIEDIRELASCPELARFRALYIRGVGLGQEDDRILARSPHLACFTRISDGFYVRG